MLGRRLSIRAGHEAKSEDLHGDKTYYELRRQYHCAAYNMLLAVITCTQNKLQFYTGFLFKEEPSKARGLDLSLGLDLDLGRCFPLACVAHPRASFFGKTS